ncbi:molybdopterin-guanine dinucleotide biosynthesis protein B [Alteribacillus iranensis]|uniref:Molybdopterin-guanine dinucleotide biosynthesis protein B n=2 Tax=Alteribacillus iranensis TaxID=930128 RepID=A0A1I2B3P7_9BACI|nr:molybdopterin-guanine dinucleotide biosynthesis protein B [Alteribacillus iranensis]
MALEQHCSILQIVGHKNSGKTTLMEKLIHFSAQDGLQAATIKHHGHGGYPANDFPPTDSSRHSRAGAFLSSVEGDGQLYLQAVQESWSLADLLHLYRQFQPDIIFVEGYKREDYPKVVLLRDKHDLHLLSECSNIFCAVGPSSIACYMNEFPFYRMDDPHTPKHIYQKVMSSV